MITQRTRWMRLTIGSACFGAVIAGVMALLPELRTPTAQPSNDPDLQVVGRARHTGDVPYGRSGMMIARDPLTGELRAPTPEEVQAMTGFTPGLGLSKSTVGLQQMVKPDGSVQVDLQGRFQSFAVAKIALDGSVVTGCVTTQKDAQDFLSTSPRTEKRGDHDE